MDHGIWATWYDVSPEEEPVYLAWCHGTLLPGLQAKPGIVWAAHYRNIGGGTTMNQLHRVAARPDEEVQGGCGYLLLVGAPSPHSFFKPDILKQISPDSPVKFRRGTRMEFYMEEARVDGPSDAGRYPGSTPASAIQFGCYQMKSVEAEIELGRWYAQQRLPTMGRTEGCVRTRKLVSVAGWAKHGVLYEFDSLEARLKYHEEPTDSQTLDKGTWTGQITANAIYPPGSPFVGERIWPEPA